MKCKECGCVIPNKRIELGFNMCVECSTEETYGTIDIVYHKTGNTVQHIDKETADKINKMARRPGFGSSLGRIGKGGHKEFSGHIEKGCSTATIGSEGMFQKVGDEMMFKLDILGYDKALTYLKGKVDSCAISSSQFIKLKKILDHFGTHDPLIN